MGFKLNRAAYSTPLCFNRFKGYFQYILIHISKTTFKNDNVYVFYTVVVEFVNFNCNFHYKQHLRFKIALKVISVNCYSQKNFHVWYDDV